MVLSQDFQDYYNYLDSQVNERRDLSNEVLLNILLLKLINTNTSGGGGITPTPTGRIRVSREIRIATTGGSIDAGALELSFAVLDGTAVVDGVTIDPSFPPLIFSPISNGEYEQCSYSVSNGGKLIILIVREATIGLNPGGGAN